MAELRGANMREMPKCRRESDYLFASLSSAGLRDGGRASLDRAGVIPSQCISNQRLDALVANSARFRPGVAPCVTSVMTSGEGVAVRSSRARTCSILCASSN